MQSESQQFGDPISFHSRASVRERLRIAIIAVLWTKLRDDFVSGYCFGTVVPDCVGTVPEDQTVGRFCAKSNV